MTVFCKRNALLSCFFSVVIVRHINWVILHHAWLMWINYQEGATDTQSKLEGDVTDSFGSRLPRRQYVPDPCRGSRGGGGDVDDERLHRAPRFNTTAAAADTDDDGNDDDRLYIFRERQRRLSRSSDYDTHSDDAVADVAQHDDVRSGLGVADRPVTLPDPRTRPHGPSSLSSGTGNGVACFS